MEEVARTAVSTLRWLPLPLPVPLLPFQLQSEWWSSVAAVAKSPSVTVKEDRRESRLLRGMALAACCCWPLPMHLAAGEDDPATTATEGAALADTWLHL